MKFSIFYKFKKEQFLWKLFPEIQQLKIYLADLPNWPKHFGYLKKKASLCICSLWLKSLLMHSPVNVIKSCFQVDFCRYQHILLDLLQVILLKSMSCSNSKKPYYELSIDCTLCTPENPAPHESTTVCMLLWCIIASETKLVKPKTCLHSKSEL